MAQALPDGFAAVIDGLHQAEYLGNALHREQGIGIPGAVGRAVIAVHSDPQLISGYVGQRGDVVGNVAETDQWTNFVENRLQQRLHVLSCHRSLNQW